VEFLVRLPSMMDDHPEERLFTHSNCDDVLRSSD
jgi:hypothetical protein